MKKDAQNCKPGSMLVGLHSLRQMTAHPLLAERHIQKTFDILELRLLYQQLLDLSRPQHLLTARIGILLKQKEDGTTEYTDDEDDGRACLLCSNIATDDCFIPVCKHNFCRTCIEDYAESQGEGEGAEEVGSQCPECDLPFEVKSLKSAKSPKKLPQKLSKQSKPPKSKSKNLSDRKTARQPGEDSIGNLPPLVRLAWLDGRGDLPPGTKLEALKRIIKARIATNPSDKQIIFTQWRAFATVLGRELQKEKIRFIYLTGDMTLHSRAEAVSKFIKDGTINLMVATLRTAGEGLNLECANVVYSVYIKTAFCFKEFIADNDSRDAWWNAAVERQAFCRVYRIGQKKETYFYKLIMRSSVDERMIEMQDRKIAMVEHTLKPSRGDLAQLLGISTKDCVRAEVGGRNMGKKLDSNDSNDSNSEGSEDEHFEQMTGLDSDEREEGDISD
ncbi:uncharacterized protein RCO7_00507 [Rhynchosporium graminicola]|uniref:RING-type domain-containing protein n=1 Tax=Rhynchosporium graminicola TaxID=2792576 RepID=A0A1E1KMH3_9HELO|nr:uncharacterized protein RCO7_00507 [Rhynchosporium commune]